MTITDKVREVLEGLGSTPDDVADSLRAGGITGTPEDPCFCPIAKLIKFAVPEAADEDLWDSDEEVAVYFVCRNFVRTPDGEFTPPYAVAQFIYRFDNEGGYVDLIDEEDG